MTWTGEMKAEALRLNALGKSAREIGEELGVSRNSVIGVIDRARRAAGIGPVKRGNPMASARKAPRKAKNAPPLHMPPPNEIAHPQGRYRLEDLPLNGCLYPTNTIGTAHFFCAAPRQDRSAYCEHLLLS